MKNNATPNPDIIEPWNHRPPVTEMSTEQLKGFLLTAMGVDLDGQPVGSIVQCMKVAEDMWVVTGTLEGLK